MLLLPVVTHAISLSLCVIVRKLLFIFPSSVFYSSSFTFSLSTTTIAVVLIQFIFTALLALLEHSHQHPLYLYLCKWENEWELLRMTYVRESEWLNVCLFFWRSSIIFSRCFSLVHKLKESLSLFCQSTFTNHQTRLKLCQCADDNYNSTTTMTMMKCLPRHRWTKAQKERGSKWLKEQCHDCI